MTFNIIFTISKDNIFQNSCAIYDKQYTNPPICPSTYKTRKNKGIQTNTNQLLFC